MDIPAERGYLSHNRTFARAAPVFAAFKTQLCFSKVSSLEIRSAMRRHIGRYSVFEPWVPGHKPNGKTTKHCGLPVPAWKRIHPSWMKVPMFRRSDLWVIAAELPFECPLCQSHENPFGKWVDDDTRIKFWPNGIHICESCHKTFQSKETPWDDQIVELKTMLSELYVEIRK